MSAESATSPALAGPPPVPTMVELPPQPSHDGDIIEFSLGKLAGSLSWLFNSVETLSKGMAQTNNYLESTADLWKRLETLENAPPPEAVTVMQERAKTPPPPPPAQVKIEMPYVPSEEERAEEAKRAVREMLDAEVAKLLEKINAASGRIGDLEDIEANRKDPWARTQTYMQEIGFLPYGTEEEKDPLVNLGQVFVLLRQDIAMCPKIKDLEEAEKKLNTRITEVESSAAADRVARAEVAAAESAKIREDLARLDDIVQGLVQKNTEDGDVAGALRDLTVRVDSAEERRFPKLENRVRMLEEAEPAEAEAVGTRKKGFLEGLAEVDLAEEVRRLRSTVECIETAMPYETRQTLQFMRETGKSGPDTSPKDKTLDRQGTWSAPEPSFAGSGQATIAPGAVVGSDNSINLVNFRAETDQQFEKYKQQFQRQQQDMTKNLKNHEKKVDMLESKVLDMWKRLPKVLAVLEPLQAQLEMFVNPPDYPSQGRPMALAGEAGTGGGGPSTDAPARSTAGTVATATNAAPAPSPVMAAPQLTKVASEPSAGATFFTATDTEGSAGTGDATAPATGTGGTIAPVAGAGAAAAPVPVVTAYPVPGITGGVTVPAVGTLSSPATVAPAGDPVTASQKAPAAAVPPIANMSQAPVLSQAKMLMGGFSPPPQASAGTGEAGMPPSKAQEFSPMAQMGSLTGLIKVALQSTTNDIQLNLRKELYQSHNQLAGGLEGKASKSELLALSNRLDAWAQKAQTRNRDRFRDSAPKQHRHQERSLSPTSEHDLGAAHVQQRELQRDLIRTPSRPEAEMNRSRELVDSSAKHSVDAAKHALASTVNSKASTHGAPFSPSLSEKKKTCHDACKMPTCPSAMKMTKSLNLLPALKPQ